MPPDEAGQRNYGLVSEAAGAPASDAESAALGRTGQSPDDQRR